MLKKCKTIISVLVALFCCCRICNPVVAAETINGPEVSVTTEKSEYSGGEEIKGAVSINNTTGYSLSNVTLSIDIPSGYTAKDGNIIAGKWNYVFSNILVGENAKATFNFVKAKDKDVVNGDKNNAVSETDKGDKNEPHTGDVFPMARVALIVILSIGGMALLLKCKKKKNFIAALLTIAMAMSLLPMNVSYAAAKNDSANGEERTVECSKDITIDGKKVTINFVIKYFVGAQTEEDGDEEVDNSLSYDGYELKWADEFNDSELNRADWNVELHNPGWVNAELQAYVDSTENIYIQDGKLVIKPIKSVDDNGNVSYTSGRINTQGKHDFKYGLFEARVKVPEGKGYLPAFWLMASDENIYGQWPRCGEIDAMEVHGSDTSKVYGTIHFGNPHRETQGTHTLSDGDFADKFHTFAVEWMPGRINWYVDGVLFHTANDWYSVTEGQGEITYPAPFDQPFYMILNLAVGGSWVGYPDETTDFENASYQVDYVRVYQKESYDENVTKPEKEIILRDPDANGNYIVNGNFAVAEDLADDKDWKFLTALEGEGTATIVNNKIKIDTQNAGTADYSIQLVQPNLPMKKGATYELTFDAYADEARTMKVDVSAPDVGYIRYMSDTVVNLTTTKQGYTYTFTMEKASDPNGRLEFNLGNTTSTATVNISNVKLKMINDAVDTDDDSKHMLTDGNFVYNGAFQEGADRMLYWDIDNRANATISVTSLSDGRRLKIVIPESATNSVVVSQGDMAMVDGVDYALSFDIQGDAGNFADVFVSGNVSDTIDLDGSVQSGNIIKFTSGNDKNLKFTFSQPGTYYLDNVRIDEDSLIKNGSFLAGFAGFEPYVDGSATATYVVDTLNEDSAADFTINNTGDAAWKIQLKQNNVELENGQWYRLSFDAKSNIDRKLMFAIQRDGSSDNNWNPYSGEEIVDLTSNYQTYELEFEMTSPTDLKSILSISMGAVGGTQITTPHRICIDNIKLEKIERPSAETIPVGQEILRDVHFSDVNSNWNINKNNSTTVTFEEGTAKWIIGDVGANDYDVQLSQKGIQLEKNCHYELKFTAESTETRKIKCDFMNQGYYPWYGGDTIELTANTPKDVTVRFTMSEDTDTNSLMTISMGKIDDSPASTIKLSNISLKKIDELGPSEPQQPEEPEPPEPPVQPAEPSMLDNLVLETNAGTTYSLEGGVYTVNVGQSTGANSWDIQLHQTGLALENGAKYQVTFKIKSSVDRKIKFAFRDTQNWSGYYNDIDLVAGQEYSLNYEYTHTGETSTAGEYVLFLGTPDGGSDIGAHSIEISNVSAKKLELQEEVLGEEMLNNIAVDVNEGTSKSFEDGVYTINVGQSTGVNNWDIQLHQTGLALENGAKYRITFTINSNVARKIKFAFRETVNWGGKYEDIELAEGEDYVFSLDYEYTGNTTNAGEYVLFFGTPDGGSDIGTHNITIKNVSVKKIN